MQFVTAMYGGGQLFILWVCLAVAALVVIAIAYSTATFHSSNAIGTSVFAKARELAWALVPIVIIVAAAAPAVTANFTQAHGDRAAPIADFFAFDFTSADRRSRDNSALQRETKLTGNSTSP